jgi:hypothetical protein
VEKVMGINKQERDGEESGKKGPIIVGQLESAARHLK